MKKILVATVVILVALALFWVMLMPPPAIPPLVMVTHAAVPPFSMLSEEEAGKVVGFDVELAAAIAEAMGRPLQIMNIDASELIPALQAGVADLALGALVITPELTEQVAVSAPYYEATPVLLIREGEPAPESTDELAGQMIGAQAGTVYLRLAREITGPGNLRRAVSSKVAIADLLNSQVDFVLVERQPVEAFQRIFPEAEIVPLPFEEAFYGVAVRQGNAELLEIVNATLAAARADGRYDQWIDRWLLQLN